MKLAALGLSALLLCSSGSRADQDHVRQFLGLWVACLEAANKQMRNDVGASDLDAAQFAMSAYCGEEERAVESVLSRQGKADQMPEAKALVKQHLMEME